MEERLPNLTLYYDILFRDVKLLNLSSPTIHNETKVIVVVCSKPSDQRIRNAIRRTWANPQLSKSVEDQFFTVVFLLGTGYMTESVKEEITASKDILQVDVLDSYANLVYKLLAAYRWIAANHPDKYVLKIDSDVVVLLDKMKETVGDPSERSIQCYVHRYSVPDRNINSRWYIPESAYPEYYLPDYCSGPMYLIKPAGLASMLEVIWQEKVFEVEDAFFTGVLAKAAGVRLRKQQGMWHRVKSSQPCVRGEGTVIGFPAHSVGALDLVKSWDHLRSIRCRLPIEHLIMSFIMND